MCKIVTKWIESDVTMKNFKVNWIELYPEPVKKGIPRLANKLTIRRSSYFLSCNISWRTWHCQRNNRHKAYTSGLRVGHRRFRRPPTTSHRNNDLSAIPARSSQSRYPTTLALRPSAHLPARRYGSKATCDRTGSSFRWPIEPEAAEIFRSRSDLSFDNTVLPGRTPDSPHNTSESSPYQVLTCYRFFHHCWRCLIRTPRRTGQRWWW